MRIISCLLLLLILLGCKEKEQSSSFRWVDVSGRDEERSPLYRLKVEEGWRVQFPEKNKSIQSTMEPLVTLQIEHITLTIHNFPYDEESQRIPPRAQIERWKRQLGTSVAFTTTPVAFSGFSGLFLEAEGIVSEKPVTYLAWAMNLGRRTEEKEMQADFTIKAVGTPVEMEKHRKSIIEMASSFELIREIPS